jgi:type IV secretion system protein TrbE
VVVPAIPTHLDAILTETPFLGGIEPKLGEKHLRMLTVTGFPNTTTPGLLDALNDLGFAYRWVTRWIALDKTDATKHLTRLQRQWFAKRKSVGAILREVMSTASRRWSTPMPRTRRSMPTRPCRSWAPMM